MDSNSENYYKNHLKTISKENKILKKKFDQFEKENIDLKRSIFELSYHYNNLLFQFESSGKKYQPIHQGEIDKFFIKEHSDHSFNFSSQLNNQENEDQSKDKGHFTFLDELRGHTGAVYTTKFSYCGKFLASCSYDQTVRIWRDSNNEPIILKGDHKQMILDIQWTRDSNYILSGGYDRQLTLFNLTEPEEYETYLLPENALIQSIEFHPEQQNIFFSGCSNKMVYVLDKRKHDKNRGSIVSIIKNDSVVNTMKAFKNYSSLVIGDSKGILKFFDLRKMNEPLNSIQSSDRPISYIGSSNDYFDLRRSRHEKKERFDRTLIAVNSFDNILRIYQQPKMKLITSFIGHTNKNWPIKNSIFVGKDSYFHSNSKTSTISSDSDSKINEKTLVATGSSDHKIYIFEIIENSQNSIYQVIEGHNSIVYSATFHPYEPILATSSDDSSIKLWGVKESKKGQEFFSSISQSISIK
ncbi:wd40 repeat protein [Anaeramoeba ignava]|uniref:Wd40 repeat protein n=1 Tax=Anaeramoeba ignava TaxID=1746090 RepID=A0A9Q0LK61_ANAIG|nr:wd40 repeat protein [Anaeramoeba ignava]